MTFINEATGKRGEWKTLEATKRIKHYKVVFLIVVVGIILYASSLNNSFIWDDNSLIVNNFSIKSWSYVSYIFISDSYHSKSLSGSFYRPIVTLSFMFDYSLWRLNPFGYHLTNVLFHILNGILYGRESFRNISHYIYTITAHSYPLHRNVHLSPKAQIWIQIY